MIGPLTILVGICLIAYGVVCDLVIFFSYKNVYLDEFSKARNVKEKIKLLLVFSPSILLSLVLLCASIGLYVFAYYLFSGVIYVDLIKIMR